MRFPGFLSLGPASWQPVDVACDDRRGSGGTLPAAGRMAEACVPVTPTCLCFAFTPWVRPLQVSGSHHRLRSLSSLLTLWWPVSGGLRQLAEALSWGERYAGRGTLLQEWSPSPLGPPCAHASPDPAAPCAQHPAPAPMSRACPSGLAARALRQRLSRARARFYQFSQQP